MVAMTAVASVADLAASRDAWMAAHLVAERVVSMDES